LAINEGHLCCGYFVSVKMTLWCAVCKTLGTHSGVIHHTPAQHPTPVVDTRGSHFAD